MSAADVSIAAPGDRASAEMLVSRLRSAGIEARVVSTVEPSWTLGSPSRATPLFVVVPRASARVARRIVRRPPRTIGEPPRILPLLIVLAASILFAVLYSLFGELASGPRPALPAPF